MTYFELFAITTLGLLVLACLAWVADRWADRELAQQPRRDQRMSPEDRAISLRDVDDYFHGVGAMRLRLHEYRRELADEKTGPDARERTEALTGKEIPHARSNR